MAEVTSNETPLRGVRIGITADRKSTEQADLFIKRGADVIVGPTMKTVDLAGDETLATVTRALAADPPDILLATTGFGMRLWFEAADAWGGREELIDALSTAMTLARGAKAASAVKNAGLEVTWRASTEAMPEMIDYLRGTVNGKRVAIQAFDPDDTRWSDALIAQGAYVIDVPVYRWLLPDDQGPANELIDQAISGDLQAVTFTSQPAVRNLFKIAGDRASDLREAFNERGLIASCVGSVCAEACTEVGLNNPVWPDPARLVAQVKHLTGLLANSNQ